MRYMEARDEQGALKRESLANVAPWARSVVVCAINYNTAQPYSNQVDACGRGWISRYAWSREDYHEAVMRRLRSVENAIRSAACDAREGLDVITRCYVDTGPVQERVYAQYAGVGWIGKNTCVINPALGSWVFLAAIICSLPLEVDAPSLDQCGTCTLCLEACPTQALVAPGVLDSTRCISYLTIEQRGAIADEH